MNDLFPRTVQVKIAVHAEVDDVSRDRQQDVCFERIGELFKFGADVFQQLARIFR